MDEIFVESNRGHEAFYFDIRFSKLINALRDQLFRDVKTESDDGCFFIRYLIFLIF